jgi:UDP-N-acetylmuramate dehydrogenase
MVAELRRNVDLKACNTLALPARCALFATVRQPEQLLALVAEARGMRRFILGGGSNLVLTGDFDGLVLHMAIAGRQLAGEDGKAWYVRVGAGENWHDFVHWTLAQGWPGLENLALIPGTVGAAPIQNIGAYGLEVAEYLHSLRAVDLDSGASKEFDRAACRFGYRDSVFKQEGWHLNGRYAITDVTFRLPKRWQARTGYADVAKELAARAIAMPTAQDIAAAVIAVRQRKLPDPANIPNAGSFFKNPLVSAAIAGEMAVKYPTLAQYAQPDGTVKLAAGWLIEQAGWKGKDLGPVGMYEQQALILVNRGGACGHDVQALATAVQQSVAERFGVALEAEPIFL